MWIGIILRTYDANLISILGLLWWILDWILILLNKWFSLFYKFRSIGNIIVCCVLFNLLAIYFCLSCLSSLFHLRIEYNLSNHVCSQSFAVYVCMKIKWSQLRTVRLPILTTARCALLLRKNFSYVYGFLFVQPFKVSIQAGSDVHSFDHVTCVLFVSFLGSEFCFIWFSCGVSCLSYLFHLRNWI